MSLENDRNQDLKEDDLTFILAIAGRIDAQGRILAEKLDKNRQIYYAYAVLDSLSSSYSMFKYFFDVYFGTNNDSMHEFMLTPASIIGIAIESLFLVTFSTLAARFDTEKEDELKQLIATAWPYVRDISKGLKNAYKGWKSAVMAISLVSGLDIKFLIAPVGLVLGIIAAANRAWLRSMIEARKVMMDQNAAFLMELKDPSLTQEQLSLYLQQNRIQYQSLELRLFSFLAVAFNGFIDGMYLYVGVLSLTVLAPQMLLAMAIMCAVYTAACIITRLYEEYDYQLRLFVTQTKCNLLLITKEMTFLYQELIELEACLSKNESSILQTSYLTKELCQLIARFEAERQILHEQSNRSFFSATLLGIKNGLYAYGALASVLFLLSSFLLLAGMAFPPTLLIGSVAAGIVFMLGFITYSLIDNYTYLQTQSELSTESYDHLIQMKRDLESGVGTSALLGMSTFRRSVNDGLTEPKAPQYFFQEWFEVFRSLFSGLGKGQKFVDFAGNAFQSLGTDGHYHDTPVMYVLGALSALLFGIFLALRALAKGFGRPPLGQVPLVDQEEQHDVLFDNSIVAVVDTAGANCNQVSTIENQTRETPDVVVFTVQEEGESTHTSIEQPPTEQAITQSSIGLSRSSSFFGFFSHNSEHRALSSLPSSPIIERRHIIRGLS